MIFRRLIYLMATGLGSGYLPFIPGTAGSLLALLIYILFPLDHFTWLIICIVLFLIGIFASGIVERDHGKDPGIVVIDEIVGQWITLLFLPRNYLIFIAGFIIFRIFDIIKPYPARTSEKFSGGMGIMLDDLIAAIYANIALHLILIIMEF